MSEMGPPGRGRTVPGVEEGQPPVSRDSREPRRLGRMQLPLKITGSLEAQTVIRT